MLSAYRFDALGEYDKTFESLYDLTAEELMDSHPQGPGLKLAITNFQAALADAESKIRDENSKNRKVPYGVLRAVLHVALQPPEFARTGQQHRSQRWSGCGMWHVACGWACGGTGAERGAG